MSVSFVRGATIALLASLGACASPFGSGVQEGAEVTRFHLEQPIARGEIAIEPVDPTEGGSLAFTQVAASVERELVEQGWRVVRDGARSEQVALVGFGQGYREATANRPAVSIGVGGGTGGWGRSGVGVGVGTSFPVGSRRSGEIVVSEMIVRLQRRSDATAFWEGRARAEARADDPLASPAYAASLLADALFEGFPGESGRTIRVE